MSPEQARGQLADRRSDVWAFGAVLFEMLTGQRAFPGEHISETLAEVLRVEPRWDLLPPGLSPTLLVYIKRCLHKDRAQRLGDIHDVRLALEGAFDAGLEPQGREDRQPRWRRLLPVAAAAVLAGVVAFASGWALRSGPPVPLISRFGVPLPQSEVLRNAGRPVMALSPDGRHLVYNTLEGLYLRAMDDLVSRVIPGTEADLANPFFAPDATSVGFWSRGMRQLMRIGLTGGGPVPIAGVPSNLFGASWERDGAIYFGQPDGIYRVPATGGEPERLIAAREGERVYGPRLLPDGDMVLFTATTATGSSQWDEGTVVAQSIRTGERHVLVQGGSDARYLPDGYLIYARGGDLFGVVFNPDSLSVVPGAVHLLAGVTRTDSTSTLGAAGAQFDVSSDGTLAYLTGLDPRLVKVPVWVDREGQEEPLGALAREYQHPRISPDGTRVALEAHDQQHDIWIWDLGRETLAQLTFDPGVDGAPVWSRDGTRVAFVSERAGTLGDLYWRSADGTGEAERLTMGANAVRPVAFSPDGRSLVFIANYDIHVATLDGTGGIRSLVETPATEMTADLSPDGKWIAYDSNESGQWSIYVRPFPDVESGKLQVSTGGGSRPAWSHDGRALFYQLEAGHLMRVPVEPGPPIRFGRAETVVEGAYTTSLTGRSWDIGGDGRFLMLKDAGQAAEPSAAPRFVVVQHWDQELESLLPGR